jgi:NADPH-dependent 2,4-dienoyl-CoA reductase/sulfur reductase-like enzyme
MSEQAAVIGAGPAGLMAAEVLARGGAQVTIYDRTACRRRGASS